MENTKTIIVKTRNFNYNLFLIKVKGIISSLMFMLFVPVMFSGIGLYFAPSGREARLTNWTFLGFSKEQLEVMHDIPGLIFAALTIIHILLNFKIYVNEIKCLVSIKR